MSHQILPHPYGHHARQGIPALLDGVRADLLNALPAPLDAPDPLPANASPVDVRRREWHMVATGFGDLVEIVTGYVAAVVAAALIVAAVAGVLVAIGSWEVVIGAGCAGALWWAAWRLKAAARRLERIVAEELSDEDGAR